MSDELTPREERMVNALVRSGVVIEEGKRYSEEELASILFLKPSKPPKGLRTFAQIAAKLNTCRHNVVADHDKAIEKIRAALAGMGAA